MNPIDLELPEGDSWAVGVSGGADSVALLMLLRRRPELRLRVAHLDHELRGRESAADAAFVQELCRRLDLPCDIARRSDIEPTLKNPPANPSARYRAIRLALFSRVVAAHGLHGVMLGHHADDVAETVLHRLIRGSGPAGLGGMAAISIVGGLRLVRPLLKIRRQALREMLVQLGQDWREDSSNQNGPYLRAHLRKILAPTPQWTGALLDLASACRALNQWTENHAGELPAIFSTVELASRPAFLARAAARRWLAAAGAEPRELSEATSERLVAMASDAATPAAQQFPGGLRVRRAGGKIRSTFCQRGRPSP